MATFYAYSTDMKEPLNLTFWVKGGRRLRGPDGEKFIEEFDTVQFYKGIAHVGDDNVAALAALRKRAAVPGSGITEDREEYLDNVLKSAEKEARLKAQLAAAKEERQAANRLIEDLKKKSPADSKSKSKGD